MVGDVGQQVQALDQRQTNQSSLSQSLAAQQQSVSGVDPNEELVSMLQFQRAFQLASRYINAVNESLAELYRII
jgi:flagellar hook-associated protein 1 FlgK